MEIEDNFMGLMRWSKLLINSAFSRNVRRHRRDLRRSRQKKRIREPLPISSKDVVDVTAAAGIKIEPVQGKDIVKLLYFKGNGLKKKISNILIPICIKKHRLLKASMLQDLEKGRKCRGGRNKRRRQQIRTKIRSQNTL